MAYNNLFPTNYQQMYYPQQYQQPIQQMQQPVQQMQQPQVQNGGTVNVQSEQEAKDYLVANGTSVTFIDTKNKKLYIKTQGFSNFDAPTFEKYKLVKDDTKEQPVQQSTIEYADRKDVESIREEIDKIKAEINKLTTNKLTEKGVINE